MSKFYIKSGLIDHLEKLFEVTKDLTHIDRINMFELLLNHYANIENTEKCLGLWTTLQEESVAPSDKFLVTLANYLESKNLPVPFIVPDLKPIKEIRKRENTERTVSRKEVSDNYDVFKGFLEEGNFEHAEDMVVNLLKKNDITSSFLIFAINKFSINGKFEIMNNLGVLLSESQKKIVSFDNKLCFAMMASGQSNAYLDILEQRLSTLTEDNKKYIDNTFPKGGILGILSNKDTFERG